MQECVSLAENFCTRACVTWGLMMDSDTRSKWMGGVGSWDANSCGCQLSVALGVDMIINGRCVNACPTYTVENCAISLADLKGGWGYFGQYVHINADGVGLWDDGKRPPFHVSSTKICGTFDVSFPDAGLITPGVLSADKKSISYGYRGAWTRTS
jgi:hypothetical protein